jgi:drug/metabolite transporter (DMT)-like permease
MKSARRAMSLFYVSISLAIISSAVYHFSQKQIPPEANPVVSLIVTYVAALLLCLALLYFVPPDGGLLASIRTLNWSTYLLALSIVGLEAGFLLVYRSGWNLGLAAVLVNVVASLILVPVALLYFKDRLTWINVVGILVCLVGLIMLNWRR